ncbi:MAG: hypothetical protein JM58_10110 [Peptococcaceae bacterium BICA1-8]|nr:MAG: hypothetical protein JM58_10110 [Peptococcaceae bacterium BICA1-8]
MKLTTKEITFLAKDFPKRTEISLFANINEALDGTEEKSLEEKGIYKGGTLTGEAKEILEIAANAKKCTRLILRDGFIYVEKYTYKVDDKIVMAENDGGEMLFSIPKNFNDTIYEISEYIGMSRIKTADIEVLLSNDEMLVLLAMVDIYRQKALLTYQGQEILGDTLTLTDISKQLEKPTPNSLVQMLKKNYKYTGPRKDKVKEIMESLIAKECAIFQDGYLLTREYAIFAKNFLIPETIIMIENFNLNKNNEMMVAGGLGVCAGIKDNLTFVFGNNEIELASVSGFQMLQMIESFLKCPDIIEEPDIKEETPALPANKFCAECGAKIVPGAAFCPNCGSKVV